MPPAFQTAALQRLMLNFRKKFNTIESMAVRECPTPESQFEYIENSCIEMAAKLHLDETFLNITGHVMEVDNTNLPVKTMTSNHRNKVITLRQSFQQTSTQGV